jgi:hypothetical protein
VLNGISNGHQEHLIHQGQELLEDADALAGP